MKKKIMLCITALTITLTLCLGGVSVYADFGDSTLKYSMRGSDVKTLQTKLQSSGYFNATATGYFGSLTKSAVVKFQKAKGLGADGIVGKSTFAALGKTTATASSTLASRGTASSATVNSIIATAKQYMGVPYVWGGESPKGFDCSGFMQYVFGKNEISLPRTASLQFQIGTSISKANLKAGDMVFFSTYKPGASHVGIYLGSGDFIHAGSSKGVTISDLSSTYYAQRYLGAKRVY